METEGSAKPSLKTCDPEDAEKVPTLVKAQAATSLFRQYFMDIERSGLEYLNKVDDIESGVLVHALQN